YHAHVYYDDDSRTTAAWLREQLAERVEVRLGRRGGGAGGGGAPPGSPRRRRSRTSNRSASCSRNQAAVVRESSS
ncbi:MAG: hypothetical protein OXC01_15170, partial [Immundisolibacterales bacterium]|nr:hypothetical protein [Immundisolibacterales bacterium]